MSTAVTTRTGALERLRDACGAGEQVERGARRRRLAQARQHRNQPALRPEVLDHRGSRRRSSSAARSSDTNSCAASGPPPFSRRATSALPTITPSANCAASTACSGVGDADAEQHRLVGDRLAGADPSHRAWRRERRAFAGDAHERHAVHEAAGALADGDEPIVGRGGRGEQHGLDVVRVGGVGPAVELVEREVGQDRAGDAGVARARPRTVGSPCGRPGWCRSSPRAGRRSSSCAASAMIARRGRAEVERPPRRLLDGDGRPSPDRRTGCRSRSRRRRRRRARARRRASPNRDRR